MSNTYFYLLIAFVAGAMMPTQAATNNKMVAVVDSPILAAFISFVVGTVALLLPRVGGILLITAGVVLIRRF